MEKLEYLKHHMIQIKGYKNCFIDENSRFYKIVKKRVFYLNRLQEMKNLHISGYHTHNNVISDNNGNCFLISDYLEGYLEFGNILQVIEEKRKILLIFRAILLNLAKAHNVQLNPIDIRPRNFMFFEDDIQFVDFDYSFYKGKCVRRNEDVSYLVEKLFSYFNCETFHLDSQSLNLYDKINIFQILISYLLNGDIVDPIPFMGTLKKNSLELLNKGVLPDSSSVYLENHILKNRMIDFDDYCIDEFLNPIIENTPLR